MRLAFPLWLIVGCGQTVPPAECDTLIADFEAETTAVRSCDEASECGNVMRGTSCGCTQDWVARLDADLTDWLGLLDEIRQLECDLSLDSDCSCPEAYGFDCVDHVCTWDYVQSTTGLPDCRRSAGDPYQLQGLAVQGDTLVVTVAYGGGCEDHDFVLCWPDGAFQESDPVQAQLEVWHDDHDDPCDAWFVHDVELDLTPLRLAWTEAYQGTTGTMLVKLGDLSVDYSF